jgi:predicted NodU family carbamoyl transferase
VPATCRVALDETTFFQFLFKRELRDAIQRSGAIDVSNADDFATLLAMIDWNTLSRVVLAHLKEEIAGRPDTTGRQGPRAVDEASVPVKHPDSIRRTAELLADGKIVAWFQAGSEFGPRALGHRSILADPRRSGVRDFINRHIKLREDFRPFAPAVLREDVSTYFQTERDSPYMLLVDQIRDEWRDRLRSIVHEDGSCRVQTVTPDWNPQFYRLLQEFKKVTGVSVLLNTSFNGRGMPIVETPQDALQFFRVSRLDVLTIGEYVIEKQPSLSAGAEWPLLQAPLTASMELNPAMMGWG